MYVDCIAGVKSAGRAVYGGVGVGTGNTTCDACGVKLNKEALVSKREPSTWGAVDAIELSLSAITGASGIVSVAGIGAGACVVNVCACSGTADMKGNT